MTLVKGFTVNHFTGELVPRKTIYGILTRLECLQAATMSQRKSAIKLNIIQQMACKALVKHKPEII